jgi:hypothetical protein
LSHFLGLSTNYGSKSDKGCLYGLAARHFNEEEEAAATRSNRGDFIADATNLESESFIIEVAERTQMQLQVVAPYVFSQRRAGSEIP